MSDTEPTSFDGRLLIGATGAGAVALPPVCLSALRAQFTGTVTVFMAHTATSFLPPDTVGLFAERAAPERPPPPGRATAV
jgi:phosphopantothenoylcysteine decarboxylase